MVLRQKGVKVDRRRGRHVRVMGLPGVTDGIQREADRLKSPVRPDGSKDRASDAEHLGKRDFKKSNESRALWAKELDVRGQKKQRE